jgi:molybdopterin-containing oxidoreductase family iron-sulfur binding subunit
MEARQHATEYGRALKGSDVKTACQDACPATAIVFGDMNDSNSEVSNYRKHQLGYHVLEELNVRPNVTYIAKLRNVDEIPRKVTEE